MTCFSNVLLLVSEMLADSRMNILFIHQSADLYGSDRVLVWLLECMQGSAFKPIVLIPCDGPLRTVLEGIGVETHIVPLVKISRSMLSGLGLVGMPLQIFKSLFAIRRVLAGRQVSVVYSNTLAVLSGAIYSSIFRRPHIWHIHEIVISPKIISNWFPKVVEWFSNRVICNSRPTSQWLISKTPKLNGKCVVIWNGIPSVPEDAISNAGRWRKSLGISADECVITLIGRINRLKGQKLFVEAAEKLKNRCGRKLRFVIMGSVPPGQDYFLHELQERINLSSEKNNILLCDFSSNVWPVWFASDIAVIPSTEPESFGLVAVEAMAAGKPVVASRLGGMTDIVVDGETGYLFEAGSADSFAEKLDILLESPHLAFDMGSAARERQRRLFSVTAFSDSVQHVIKETLNVAEFN